MDTNNHLEHLRHVERIYAVVVRENRPKQEQEATTSEGGKFSDEPNERATGDPTESTSTATTLSTSTAPPERRNQGGKSKAQRRSESQQQDGVQMVQETDHDEEDTAGQNLDCTERICALTQLELERVALHSSLTRVKAETFCRRRQSLAYLLYRGLVAMYRRARAGARRTFVWECAADIGRIKQLLASSTSAGGGDSMDTNTPAFSGVEEDIIPHHSSRSSGVVFTGKNNHSNSASTCNNTTTTTSIDSERDALFSAVAADGGGRTDEIDLEPEIEAATRATEEACPEAAGDRETKRATRELRNEANRVALRDKLQREVLRRSNREVIRLLAVDGLRRAPVDGGGMWSKGRQQDDGRYGGNRAAESIQV